MSKTEQKLANFKKALKALENSFTPPPTEDRDFAGIIQSFEFTYELFWKLIKTVLEENGIEAQFPRKAFEQGFKHNMLEGNEIWKDIIEARNQTVHTYDSDLAKKMVPEIRDKYLPVFQGSLKKIEPLIKKS